MRSLYVILGLGAFLAIAAFVTRSGVLWRQNPGRPINSAMREALDRQQPQWSTEDEKVLNERFATARKLPSGLRYIVRAQGSGEATPTIGAEVIAHYDGRLLDGTPFDSSYKRGAPFTFRTGTGAVIAGWDEAFRTMKRGEKRTLIIPYWLAYGEKGKGSIPPKATLIFEVELVDWR
ncbi:MAG: FKBP-type peptidyl-prolyl cis-trans isomerase [Opitutaceae bacterium]|nr:FKBP-type peptidyl-prolyl cis-trans isomerase [Opitutaceae bacterium]